MLFFFRIRTSHYENSTWLKKRNICDKTLLLLLDVSCGFGHQKERKCITPYIIMCFDKVCFEFSMKRTLFGIGKWREQRLMGVLGIVERRGLRPLGQVFAIWREQGRKESFWGIQNVGGGHSQMHEVLAKWTKLGISEQSQLQGGKWGMRTIESRDRGPCVNHSQCEVIKGKSGFGEYWMQGSDQRQRGGLKNIGSRRGWVFMFMSKEKRDYVEYWWPGV